MVGGVLTRWAWVGRHHGQSGPHGRLRPLGLAALTSFASDAVRLMPCNWSALSRARPMVAVRAVAAGQLSPAFARHAILGDERCAARAPFAGHCGQTGRATSSSWSTPPSASKMRAAACAASSRVCLAGLFFRRLSRVASVEARAPCRAGRAAGGRHESPALVVADPSRQPRSGYRRDLARRHRFCRARSDGQRPSADSLCCSRR